MPDLSFDPTDLDRPGGPLLIVAAGRDGSERTSAPHRHASGQLFGSTRGLLSIGIEDAVWIVPAIRAVWVPPYYLHAARSHGPFEGWKAYVAEAACHDLPKKPCVIRTSGLLREAVLRAAQWSEGPPDAPGARVAAVILDEIRTLPFEPFELPLPRDPRLQLLARALIDKPADLRNLDSWAKTVAISTRTLSRRFVAETGLTFTAWRQRARLMKSLEMLAANTPVANIALDLGYSTASTFISLFRRTFGETPASYGRRAFGPTPAPGRVPPA